MTRKKVGDRNSEKSKKRKKVGDRNSEKLKKRKKVGGDWVHLPDIPVPIIWGRRSRNDGEHKNWVCACGTTNYASRHLLVDLPAFKCSNQNCNVKPVRVNFRFSFGNLNANGVSLIGDKIYNQRKKPDCLIFALAKACEISANIRNILLGNGKCVGPLDSYSFKSHLQASMKDGVESTKINYNPARLQERICNLLATEGIRELGGHNIYKFKSLDCGGGDDDSDNDDDDGDEAFEALATTLADGSPVLATIVLGRNFGDLQYGKVYKSPKEAPFVYETDSDDEATGDEEGKVVVEGKVKRKCIITHLVVLVGAARRGDMNYYYFLNSWGVTFCVRVNTATGSRTSGIGKIFAEDASYGLPFKILAFA